MIHGSIHSRANLLHLANDLTGLAQALDHLLALFSSPDGVVAFLQEFVKFLCSVHLFEEFSLHLVFGEPRKLSAPSHLMFEY